MTAPPPGREEPIALVVAKAPVAGRVKTRLAEAIGLQAAADLARAMLLDTLEACRREIEAVGVLCANDDDVELLAELAGPEAPLVAQNGIGLTDALETGIAEGLRLGSPVFLVSSDLPGLPAGALCRALALLSGGSDIVLGPGPDGGYWLIGSRGTHPGLFEGIPWSTPGVLEATLDRCRAQSLDVRLLEPWLDVDTGEDLARIAGRSDALPGHRTAALVAQLGVSGTKEAPAA